MGNKTNCYYGFASNVESTTKLSKFAPDEEKMHRTKKELFYNHSMKFH
jgi:hypothetical protein